MSVEGDNQVDSFSDLDYFAAHAPAEIPEWFMPEPCKKPPMPEPPKEIKEEAEAWLKDGCYDLAYAFDVDSAAAVAQEYQDSVEKWSADCREAEAAHTERRYFGWRWYYAAMMLVRRKEWAGQ